MTAFHATILILPALLAVGGVWRALQRVSSAQRSPRPPQPLLPAAAGGVQTSRPRVLVGILSVVVIVPALVALGWNVWTSETSTPAKVLFAAKVQVGQEAFNLPSLQQGQSFRVVPMRGGCVEALDAEKAVMARVCNYDDNTCPTTIVPPDHTADVPRFIRARGGEAPVVANIVVCDNLLPHCKLDCT